MIEIINQKITNADRIRNMTVKELADVIACPNTVSEVIDADYCMQHSCEECKQNWLRQEA